MPYYVGDPKIKQEQIGELLRLSLSSPAIKPLCAAWFFDSWVPLLPPLNTTPPLGSPLNKTYLSLINLNYGGNLGGGGVEGGSRGTHD